MKTTNLRLSALLLIALTFFSTACDNDGIDSNGEGEVEFEITDAPIDDAEVKSVMVTVSEVKVDGKSISGFQRQTIDLVAYQNGNTKVIGSQTLAARTYSTITLVLDLDTDDQGNSPGCYVLTKNLTKHKLKTTTTGKTEVTIKESWRTSASTKTRMVIDFDLRKAIRYSADETGGYAFVNDQNLQAAVRVVTKERSSRIEGVLSNTSDFEGEKVIVYAYKKGTFHAGSEIEGQTSDGITFKNAVSSAEVRQALTGRIYTLAHLAEGEYELHFASYNRDASSGKIMFNGMLSSETEMNGSILNMLSFKNSSTVNVSTTLRSSF
jgi:hypothetical protein